MSVVHDASNNSGVFYASPTTVTFNVPGAAGANSVVVVTYGLTRTVQQFLSVTYGGVSLTQIYNRGLNSGGELYQLQVWANIGVSVPGGTQQVAATHQGLTGAKWVAAATMIADDPTALEHAWDFDEGDIADPSVAVASGAFTAQRYTALAVRNNAAVVSPDTGLTELETYTQSSRSAHFGVETTPSAGTPTLSYTSPQDDTLLIGVGFWNEGIPSGGTSAAAAATVGALGQRWAADGASAAANTTASSAGAKTGVGGASAAATVTAAAAGLNPAIPGGSASVSVAVSATAAGADATVPKGSATSHAAVTVAAAGAKTLAGGSAAVNVGVQVRALGPFIAPPGHLNGDRTLTWGVELAIGDGALWGSAEWSTSEWVGVDLEWVDVTDWVVRWSSQSATRATFNDSFRTGSATCRLQNWGGEWVGAGGAPGQVPIRPGIRIRAYLDADGTRETLWTGYVTTQRESYGLQGEALTDLQAIDALGRFGAIQLSEGKLWNNGIATGTGVGRVLTHALWPNGANWRDLATGLHTLDAYEITEGDKALDLLRRLGEAEGGAVFTDRDSRVVFRDRDWLSSTKGQPPAYELGTIGGNEEQVRIMRPLIRSDQRIVNEATLRRESTPTPAQTGHAYDLASKGKYGRRSVERSDLLCRTKDQLTTLATRLVTNRREERPEIESVSVRPPSSARALALVQLPFGAVVEVKWTHPRNGWDVSGVGNLLGIKHKLNKSGLWEAELLLDATYQEA